jgi:hypothetical protein
MYKNRVPLPLIGEILDYLSVVKVYTKFNLKDIYYCIRLYKNDK